MSTFDDRNLITIAWRLDRLRWVPSDVLTTLAVENGACMRVCADGDSPPWITAAPTDRELAARICSGCPVQDECLELELRTAGDDTVGVWGALGENDRRALHPQWLARGERADAEGGPRG